jgi:hypothetical protein
MAEVKWFGAGAQHLVRARVDWVSDTIKLMLVTSAYTPNQDTHDYRDDVTGEISGTGYTAGGVSLTGKSRSYDSGTNEERLDADDIVFSSLDPSTAFRWGVGYKARGGAASADELIFYVDFGADRDPNGAEYRIVWHANGILKLTAS